MRSFFYLTITSLFLNISAAQAEVLDFSILRAYLNTSANSCMELLKSRYPAGVAVASDFDRNTLLPMALENIAAQGDDAPVYLFVGLGNHQISGEVGPGKTNYNNTPHNLGARFIDHFVTKHVPPAEELVPSQFPILQMSTVGEMDFTFPTEAEAKEFVGLGEAAVVRFANGETIEETGDHKFLVRLKVGAEYTAIRGGFGALTEKAKVIFMKPMFDINMSGIAVAAMARQLGIPPERIVVIHDDMDIERGLVKLKKGSAGELARPLHSYHNGLFSINHELGSSQYYRIRVGIGRPPRDRDNRLLMSIPNWVLREYSALDNDLFLQERNFRNVWQAIRLIANDEQNSAARAISTP